MGDICTKEENQQLKLLTDKDHRMEKLTLRWMMREVGESLLDFKAREPLADFPYKLRSSGKINRFQRKCMHSWAVEHKVKSESVAETWNWKKDKDGPADDMKRMLFWPDIQDTEWEHFQYIYWNSFKAAETKDSSSGAASSDA